MSDDDFTPLLELARQGDTDAESALFRKLHARFTVFARQRIWNPQDAGDIVQEAILVIGREYKNIEFTRSFAAWAYKVLDNRILGYIQAHKRRRAHRESTIDDDLAPDVPAPEIDPQFKQELLDCLRQVGLANIRYSRILNLHYQGYSTAEICERLNLTRNNLYSVLSRARSLLHLCLDKKEHKE